jgi:hypothetical protein
MPDASAILTDLQTRLSRNQPTADAVVLNSATLPAGAQGEPDRLLALIGNALKTSSLSVVYAAPPALSDDGKTLSVGGTATVLDAAGCAVTLKFTVSDDGKLNLDMRADLPAGWHFAQSFPALDKSDPDNLSLTDALFWLTSYAHSEPGLAITLAAGLNFQATAQVSNDLSPLTADLAADKVQGVVFGGLIDNSGAAPSFNLQAASALSDLTFEVLSLGTLTMTGGLLSVKSVPGQNGGPPSSSALIRGAVGLSSLSVKLDLDAPLTYPERLGLMLAETGKTLSGMSLVTDLVGGTDLTSFLPQQLTGMGAMGLTDLRLQIAPATKDYSLIAVAVGSDQEHFRLIPNVLEMRGFKLGLSADSHRLDASTTNRNYKGLIGGSFTLGDVDVDVDVTISSDEWVITIREASPGKPTLKSVASYVGSEMASIIGPLPEPIRAAIQAVINAVGTLDIKEVEIGVAVSKPALSVVAFTIEQVEAWDITSFLSVSGWSIRTRLVNTGSSWQTRGVLEGTIQLGLEGSRIPIGIRVVVPAEGGNWTLSLAQEPFTLPDLRHIFYLLGINEVSRYLPQGLGTIGGLTVTRLDIVFNTSGASIVNAVFFALRTSQAWELMPGSLVVENVRLTLWLRSGDGQGGAYLAGVMAGTVKVFGADLSLRLQKMRKEDPWLFELATLNFIHIPGLSDLASWMLPGDMLQYLPPSFMPFGAGFNLTALKLDFDISSTEFKEIGFSIRNAEVWNVIPGYVSLDQTYVTASITRPGKPSQDSSVHIEGTLTIAGVDITLKADKAKSELGTSGGAWQFQGSTGTGQAIHIGTLVADIVKSFGDVTLPSAIADLVIENLTVLFNTGTKNLTFRCEAKFPVDGKEADITVLIELNREGATYTKTFGGTITIGNLAFDLKFVQNAASDFFVAAYRPRVPGSPLDVKQLVASVSADVASYVPEGLTIELKDIIFGYGKVAQSGETQGTAQSKFILGLDIGTGINLSNLPLVGQEFPKDATVGVDDLQILFVSKGLTAAEVGRFNALIPDGVAKLPLDAQQGAQNGGDGSAPAFVIGQGFNISAKLNFGGSTQALSLPASGSPAQTGAGSGTTTAPAANTSTTDSAKWFMLQKAFGPVYFEKVGVQYQDKKVWFLLSATLTAAGLTLSLDGLAVGGSLDKYMPPSFDLRGIGVGYSSGPVTISGAFLRQKVTRGNVTYDEYSGAALIKTEQLSLSALGSYAYMDGHPSLFVYAVLDYPIGGPSFFFVTGLAAGFGFNRALVSPAIEQVAQFPLVAEAVAGAAMPANLSGELEKLRRYIPAAVGQYFLAVGIKFTSFKLVDSFALLTVSFGRRFEVDVLGLSTLIVPTPIPGQTLTPLAEVQMAVKASYVPDDGFLGVSARLTSASFILSRDCHLTGGFAFWSWLSGEHAGDFVLTLGGYHPDYKVPAHYPTVPRLGFNWRVDGNISIKGDIYCALTASTLMAGGSLQATWESGSLKAWFSVGANFIIAWKPYHYDATMYVDIGVSYTYHFFGTHHLNVNVGADLHIWGPEFAGKAHIKLSVISFDIEFGSGSSKTAKPIDWPTFKASFLPADSQVCTLAIKDGLTKDSDAGWVVNPKEFKLVTNSLVPASEAYTGSTVVSGAGGGAALGIAPMAVGSYVGRHTITIRKDGKPYEDQFDFVPVKKKVPAAMWGRSFSPSLNGAAFVENALAGFEIKPKAKPKAGATAAIDPGVLQYSSEPVPEAFAWEVFAEFVPGAGSDAERTSAVKRSLADLNVADARSQLLSAFGIQTTVTAGGDSVNSFLAAPQTGTLAA